MNALNQMIPEQRRPKNQLPFPLTSTELEKERDAWRKRAEVAEGKIEELEEAMEKAFCAVLGHNESHSDYGSYCSRCGEDLK